MHRNSLIIFSVAIGEVSVANVGRIVLKEPLHVRCVVASQLLRDNINSVVLGKSEVVESCLTALLAGEHFLLEDVPGVGKTLVGKAIAKSLAGEFRRIQFTSDLLPSDIVGSNVFNTRTSEFSFHKGPIFANVVLADEINRAPPRTQSALPRGHERTTSLSRWRNAHAADAFHRDRDAKSIRDGGNLFASGKPDGSLLAANLDGLPWPQRRATGAH